LTIGIKEQLAFPEIRADEIKENWGMSITFSLKNTANKDLVREYLEEIGFKFSDSKNSKDKE
jgi:ribosomal protein L5